MGEQIAGDGSGGSWVFTANMQQSGSMFGPHAMFDLRYVSVNVMAALANLTISAFVFAYERTTGGYYTDLEFNMLSVDTQKADSRGIVLPDYRFRFSDDPSNPTQVQIYVSPNTNAYNCRCSFGGYIYDERELP